jgi:putative nucleotidyltransferase with HDIG domain
MVGIRGIKNLLYSYGTQKILGDDTASKKALWEHSYKVAFYAYNMVRNFKREKNLLDDVYVSGILHDMGKIVFSNVHPDLLNNIRNFCQEKGLPLSTFEDLAAGLNHSEIGALIAEKWNFPEPLVMAIRYHHDPESANPEYRELVQAVYLANMFCEYEKGNVNYDQFDVAVLDSYGITSKKQMDSMIFLFAQGFNRDKEQ